MEKQSVKAAFFLGAFICVGLIVLGLVLGNSLIRFKEYERSVVVKGLAEREVDADIAIWPIEFVSVGDELGLCMPNWSRTPR